MKQKYLIPTDSAILAYAAGLFDGEGCILIAKPYNKRNDRRYHRLDVSIGQKDPRPLLWMLENFGGRIQGRPGLKTHPIPYWVLHDKAAGDFLAAIRPYLVLKGDQADIALAFRVTIRPNKLGNKRLIGGWGKTAFAISSPVDDALEAKRDKLRDELSRLKVVK